ncbi:MAG: transposase [Bacillota bacterium]|nr:transposase [Bacillota bacterium]
MPRTARIKNDAGIYHIMVRSISDVSLFKDSLDKDRYLDLVRKYQQIFLFKVYAYCIMTTHAHFAIDCCGADISKIMKSVDQCYSAYFNKKYSRHGHVFQDRFKSNLIDNENYLMVLTAYIHNNPRDIIKYKNCAEKYKYSSFGIYLGISEDKSKILDTDFILGHFSNDTTRAKKSYLEFINRVTEGQDKIDIEFKNDGSECRSERKILIRDLPPDKIIDFISNYTGAAFNIHIKFIHSNTDLKALSILVMRFLCNLSLKDICASIGNITISTVCRLYEKGYRLISESRRYATLMDDIISKFSAA